MERKLNQINQYICKILIHYSTTNLHSESSLIPHIRILTSYKYRDRKSASHHVFHTDLIHHSLPYLISFTFFHLYLPHPRSNNKQECHFQIQRDNYITPSTYFNVVDQVDNLYLVARTVSSTALRSYLISCVILRVDISYVTGKLYTPKLKIFNCVYVHPISHMFRGELENVNSYAKKQYVHILIYA